MILQEPPARPRHQKLFDLIFPPRCVGCARPGHWICPRCWTAIPWLPEGHCIHCEAPHLGGRLCARCLRPAGESAAASVNPYALVRHDGIARDAVHELKYTPHTDIASVLGAMMAPRLAETIRSVVVPVPLHWSRKRQRGFNQSELLARSLARAKGLKIDAGSLRRHRRTADQVGLGRSERVANVSGAFRWQGDRIKEPVLLVDDVYTTGSTLNACAEALRLAGATHIDAVVFACAPLSSSESEQSK